jgi:hypothetical protein
MVNLYNKTICITIYELLLQIGFIQAIIDENNMKKGGVGVLSQ